MTVRACRACKNWHDLSEPWPAACVSHFQGRTAASGPQVISDTMESTWHPATGRRISSKAKFRAETRAAGCVEVGNERMAERSTNFADIGGGDIKQSIEQIRSRR